MSPPNHIHILVEEMNSHNINTNLFQRNAKRKPMGNQERRPLKVVTEAKIECIQKVGIGPFEPNHIWKIRTRSSWYNKTNCKK